jgi:uncharacterized membrane protein
MSTRRPVHPILVAVPFVAFAVTLVALIGHAATDEAAWYRLALYADVAGVIAATIATLAGMVDAANLPAFTPAREAGLRHVAFDALALVFFAASGAVMYRNLEAGRVLGDGAPLLLGVIGLGAMLVAGWYTRALLRLYRIGRAIGRYPARSTQPLRG